MISIILPTFNRLEYLRLTLESVFAQTFEDWELIVADDGSDVATREYLGALAGAHRIKRVWLSHTGNPAAVRNAALREARGDYVAFLDSDDLWAPRKLESQMALLRQRRGRQWSYTAFTRVDRRGVPLPEESGRLVFGDDGPIVSLTMRDLRCVMINFDPDTAESDPRIMKGAVRLNENYAGGYGTVVRTGEISVGQPVNLIIE